MKSSFWVLKGGKRVYIVKVAIDFLRNEVLERLVQLDFFVVEGQVKTELVGQPSQFVIISSESNDLATYEKEQNFFLPTAVMSFQTSVSAKRNSGASDS